MLSPVNEEYAARYATRLVLKNKKEVFLRPIRPSDKTLIVDLLNKLSPDSVYLRFLRPVSELSETFLFQVTHINYTDNFALVAVIEEDSGPAIIASARYGYNSEDKTTDFAIVVRDDWQHNGLGQFMLNRIFAVGREHGITRFVSVINSTNHIMKQLLRNLACPVKYSYDGGVIQVAVFPHHDDEGTFPPPIHQ